MPAMLNPLLLPLLLPQLRLPLHVARARDAAVDRRAELPAAAARPPPQPPQQQRRRPLLPAIPPNWTACGSALSSVWGTLPHKCGPSGTFEKNYFRFVFVGLSRGEYTMSYQLDCWDCH